jgi:putative transposase
MLMDVFTRSIRGWHLARSMEVSLTITALNKGLAKGQPEIHHSDQGVQYTANEYVKLLEQHAVKISMVEVGQAIALRAFKKGRTACRAIDAND